MVLLSFGFVILVTVPVSPRLIRKVLCVFFFVVFVLRLFLFFVNSFVFLDSHLLSKLLCAFVGLVVQLFFVRMSLNCLFFDVLLVFVTFVLGIGSRSACCLLICLALLLTQVFFIRRYHNLMLYRGNSLSHELCFRRRRSRRSGRSGRSRRSILCICGGLRAIGHRSIRVRTSIRVSISA